MKGEEDGTLDVFRGHRLVPHAPSPYAGTRGAYLCSHYGCDYHVLIVDGAEEGIVHTPPMMPNASIVGPRTAKELGDLPDVERKKIRYCPIGERIAQEVANRSR